MRDLKSLHAEPDLDVTAHRITTMFSSAMFVLPSLSRHANRNVPLSSTRAANARYGFSATAVSRSYLNTGLPLNSQVNALMILRGIMSPFLSLRWRFPSFGRRFRSDLSGLLCHGTHWREYATGEEVTSPDRQGDCEANPVARLKASVHSVSRREFPQSRQPRDPEVSIGRNKDPNR